MIVRPDVESHVPFFSYEVASEVLIELERVFTKSEPIPDSTDMPVSPALRAVFNAAMALSIELRHQPIEPLHLLAATLSESKSKASEVLKRAGVTKEAVIAAIRTAK
jgi:ATP-dependent Clp protease ATP-binding subunit ClpA